MQRKIIGGPYSTKIKENTSPSTRSVHLKFSIGNALNRFQVEDSGVNTKRKKEEEKKHHEHVQKLYIKSQPKWNSPDVTYTSCL